MHLQLNAFIVFLNETLTIVSGDHSAVTIFVFTEIGTLYT